MDIIISIIVVCVLFYAYKRIFSDKECPACRKHSGKVMSAAARGNKVGYTYSCRKCGYSWVGDKHTGKEL